MIQLINITCSSWCGAVKLTQTVETEVWNILVFIFLVTTSNICTYSIIIASLNIVFNSTNCDYTRHSYSRYSRVINVIIIVLVLLLY